MQIIVEIYASDQTPRRFDLLRTILIHIKISNTLGNLIYGGCDKSFTVTPDGGLIYLCKSARGYWNANVENRPILYLKQGKLNVTLYPEPTLNKAGKIIKSRSSRNSPLSNRIKQ